MKRIQVHLTQLQIERIRRVADFLGGYSFAEIVRRAVDEFLSKHYTNLAKGKRSPPAGATVEGKEAPAKGNGEGECQKDKEPLTKDEQIDKEI